MPIIELQQHLPFTVLKPTFNVVVFKNVAFALQQHLPFTVLKLFIAFNAVSCNFVVATAPTVYGIETWRNVFS